MNFSAPTLGLKPKALFIEFAAVVLKFGCLTPLLAGTDKLLRSKQLVHNKNCRGGGVDHLKRVRCNKLFATVRARAAHETSCCFCRWCDRMVRQSR